jgi:hypothetical protein
VQLNVASHNPGAAHVSPLDCDSRHYPSRTDWFCSIALVAYHRLTGARMPLWAMAQIGPLKMIEGCSATVI